MKLMSKLGAREFFFPLVSLSLLGLFGCERAPEAQQRAAATTGAAATAAEPQSNVSPS